MTTGKFSENLRQS